MAEQLKQNNNKIAYIVSSGNYHRKVYQNGSSYLLTTYTSASQGTEYSVSASAKRNGTANSYEYRTGGSYTTNGTRYSVTSYKTKTLYTGYVSTSSRSAPGAAITNGRYSKTSNASYSAYTTYTYPSKYDQYGTTAGSVTESHYIQYKVTSTTGESTYTASTSVAGSAYSNKSGSYQTTYNIITYIPDEYRTVSTTSQFTQTSKATTWEFAYSSFTGTRYSSYLSSSTIITKVPASVFNGQSTTLYKSTNNSITSIYTNNATFNGTEITTPVGSTATCNYTISASSSSATGGIRYTW